jgi:PAS domain S-box-containing protein
MTRLPEFSPDASLLVDAAGTIVLLNAQAASLFGYGQGELLGQPLKVLLPEHLHRVHVAERLHYMEVPHGRPIGTGLNLVERRKDGRQYVSGGY